MNKYRVIRILRILRILAGAGIATFLIFFEAPYVYYCEWFSCSVVVPFNWYQPLLFAIAAYLLCSELWLITEQLPILAPTKFEHDLSAPFVEGRAVGGNTFSGYNPQHLLPPTKYYFIDYVPDGAYYGG